MRYIKTTALFLILSSFSLAAQAGIATWDFSWERSTRSNTYTGIGMFSYAGSPGDFVTHGRSRKFGDLNDELVAFSFEGFVNDISIGATHALPKLFAFSPDDELIVALKAKDSGSGIGIRCVLNRCSLREDGDRIRRSGGKVHVTQRDHRGGSTTSLPEPGLFGLTMLGIFLGLWYRRHSQQTVAAVRSRR